MVLITQKLFIRQKMSRDSHFDKSMVRMQPWSLGHGEKRGTGGF